MTISAQLMMAEKCKCGILFLFADHEEPKLPDMICLASGECCLFEMRCLPQGVYEVMLCRFQITNVHSTAHVSLQQEFYDASHFCGYYSCVLWT